MFVNFVSFFKSIQESFFTVEMFWLHVLDTFNNMSGENEAEN